MTEASNSAGRASKINGVRRCKPFQLCIRLESIFLLAVLQSERYSTALAACYRVILLWWCYAVALAEAACFA
jgi:hypothetical protein